LPVLSVSSALPEPSLFGSIRESRLSVSLTSIRSHARLARFHGLCTASVPSLIGKRSPRSATAVYGAISTSTVCSCPLPLRLQLSAPVAGSHVPLPDRLRLLRFRFSWLNRSARMTPPDFASHPHSVRSARAHSGTHASCRIKGSLMSR